MSHELTRLTSSLCNTPLLVTEDYLQTVMEILRVRNEGGGINLAVTDKLNPQKRSLQYFPDMKLGVVDIHGGITDIPYYGLCGETGVSHQSIREEVEQLIAEGAKVIVLDQDSNGGIAHMAFESASYIRNLADDNEVKLISYISAKSFSASYVYSAVAHEVIINPSAEAGSIGVKATLRNINGYMKNLGIEDVYITAGDGKVPFDSEGNFTEDFLSEIKDSVLETYQQFVGHVAMWRGMEPDKVKAIGAKTYSAQKSINNGLVDKIMTLKEFESYLYEITTGEEMSNPVTNLFNRKTKDTNMSLEQVAELEASLQKLTADYNSAVETLSTTQNELAVALQKLADLEKAQKEAKEADRKSKLEAAVGTTLAATLMQSLSSLSDEAFETTLSALSKVSDDLDDAEQGSKGVETSAQESLTAIRLKEKYQSK